MKICLDDQTNLISRFSNVSNVVKFTSLSLNVKSLEACIQCWLKVRSTIVVLSVENVKMYLYTVTFALVCGST
jgi:hypothetical protein